MAVKQAKPKKPAAKAAAKKPTVSHYVRRGAGLVCDACGGKVKDHAEPAVFPQVPWWMKKCPICGLRITKVEEPNEDSTELYELQDIALNMLVMIGLTDKAPELAERMIQCGVPQEHVVNALKIAQSFKDVADVD